MSSNNLNSYETSWADQWDPEPLYGHPNSRTSNSSNSGNKLTDKTKAAASTGAKKVKAGAAAGIQWIKHKYHKTTAKH